MQVLEFLIEIVVDTIREVVATILGQRAEESVGRYKKKKKARRRNLSRGRGVRSQMGKKARR